MEWSWGAVGFLSEFYSCVRCCYSKKKNIEFYSKGNPSLRMTQQFIEFPRLLKHHQIHPQKLLRFLSISACPSGWLGMAMPLGHVSQRIPVPRRAKRKKADKAGKEL